MKIDLVIISAILVMLVFLPFVLIPLIQSRGNKSLQKKFKEEVSKLNLTTDIIETWNQNMLGIDSAQKKLLFVQKLEEEFIMEFIDLSLVKQADINFLNSRPIGHHKNEELKKVILDLSLYNAEDKKSIVLYDNDLNYNQDLEVMNAEKVKGHIQKLILSRPVLKRTA